MVCSQRFRRHELQQHANLLLRKHGRTHHGRNRSGTVFWRLVQRLVHNRGGLGGRDPHQSDSGKHFPRYHRYRPRRRSDDADVPRRPECSDAYRNVAFGRGNQTHLDRLDGHGCGLQRLSRHDLPGRELRRAAQRQHAGHRHDLYRHDCRRRDDLLLHRPSGPRR